MKNKILIYDDNCPFCTWYSGLFVKYRLLDAAGRKPFSQLEPDLLNKIDLNKGRNEIPLVDAITGNVDYGMDALLEILGQKASFIKTAGNIRPIKWLLRKLYKLISYNRKLIVAKKCGGGRIDCSPDMNYRYRLLFMGICLLFNSIMLFPLHTNVLVHLSYYHLSITELQIIHFALVFINCSLTSVFRKEKAVEYIGQINMLALLTILLILPLLIIAPLISYQWFVTTWLILTAIIVFREYLRRMDYAGILSRNKWVASINLTTLVAFILILFS